MKKIAIFASGNGSNALNIIGFFRENPQIKTEVVFCNNPDAPVVDKAHNAGVKTIVFNKEQLNNSDGILQLLTENEIDIIVLAGFLWLIPEIIIDAYPFRIINIHPALLPEFGGKGMYGHKVHEAVINKKETESGITIHFVNKHYDEGSIIHQSKCEVSETDTPETLAAKIHELEHKYYPKIVEQLALGVIP